MKYVITGMSRLTGERVVISKPMEKEMAVQLRKKKALSNNRYSAFTRLKIRPALQEGCLFE